MTVKSVESPEALIQSGLLHVPEAAALLRISRSMLYVLMDRGDLAFTTVGRRRLIPRRALLNLAVRGLRGAK